jgi:hypothetical protein
MLSIKPVLERLGQGTFFRSKFALLLRVMAILLAIMVLIAIINMWRGGLSDAPGANIFAGILFQVFLVVGTYFAVHTMFIRANDVAQLLEGTYTVIPIASIFLKMVGEVYAIMMIVVTIGATFAAWIMAAPPRGLTGAVEPFAPSTTLLHGIDNAFLGGLALLVVGVVSALLYLFFFYVLSEIVVVLGDVGTSARRRV